MEEEEFKINELLIDRTIKDIKVEGSKLNMLFHDGTTVIFEGISNYGFSYLDITSGSEYYSLRED